MVNYTISSLLLETLKKITQQITELNFRKFQKIVLLELELEANAQSSHSSTGIEGNPLPLTEVKKLIKSQPKNIRDTEREVLNYNAALIWIKEALETENFKVNSKFVLNVHKLVTTGLLPKSQSGKYRTEPVFVNDPKLRKTIYWPPDHQDAGKLLKELFEFVHDNADSLDPVILAGIFHKQFVIIHPFVDGNGRTVRLVTKALLAKLGLDTFHLFSFENYYNRNVSSYFKQVGVRGNYYDVVSATNFTPWLEYFSAGILDELLRVRKILEVNDKPRSPNELLSEDQEKIIQFIRENGHIKDKDYAKLTKRAKATRALDFKKLVELGYIERQKKGPATYYVLKNKDRN